VGEHGGKKDLPGTPAGWERSKEIDMRYVIVGGSAAAISAVEAIRSLDEKSEIDLFSDEETPLFSRVLLPYYVAEELSKPLLNFRPADFFEKNNVTAHLGVRVGEVLVQQKSVLAGDGKEYPFDKLLLATGGHPILPRIPGIEKEGISTLKTMADAERIYRMKGNRAVVVGAGSIGVEAAISLKRRGLDEVTLLEQLEQVMPTVFDAEAATIVRRRIEEIGVRVLTGEKAIQFRGNGRVKGVSTDARQIPCNLVVVAVGVKPAAELADQAGIELGAMGGIKVSERLMTSVRDIYAAGDVAETYDIARDRRFLNAIWPCAFEQGRVAGLNMGGRRTVYVGSYRRNSIGNFIGIPAISMGVTRADDHVARKDGDEIAEIQRRTKETYRKLILRNGRVIGAILVGSTQKAGLFSMLLQRQVDVTDFVPTLMSNSLNYLDILPLIRRNADRFMEPEYKELMDTGV
jgi:nitrite reductase (NADH) large subunit